MIDRKARVSLEEIRDDIQALLDEGQMESGWMAIARAELGISEIRGREHNPRIVEYHSSTGLSADSDETPWCSSFVNWCIEQAGLKGTNSARARSWMNWGDALEEPKVGCVVVFSRPPKPASGHVAFYVGANPHADTIKVLGGNQGNAVSIKGYSKSRILGYRWPSA